MTAVLFLTEGGAGVGLGHLRRCLALAGALADHGIRCKFAVAGGNEAETFVARAGFDVTGVSSFEDLDTIGRVTSSSRAVVIDSYRASEVAFRASRAPVVCLDDLANRTLPVVVVVNAAVNATASMYSSLTDARLLLGPQHALLRREFAQPVARVTKPRVDRVLVTFGGGDAGAVVRAVVGWLPNAFPAAAIDVVAGPFAGDADVGAANVLRDPDMRAAMLDADLAVSAGGQTLFELAATALPAITVTIAANQRDNVSGFAAAGTIRSAGEADDANLERQFIDAARAVADPAEREEMSRRGRLLVDGRGASRVADEIVTLLRKGAE
jgi:UDP-2,4-diacetamido-2,4,6-trideoxy-beta-L-altropyranose hydrolase